MEDKIKCAERTLKFVKDRGMAMSPEVLNAYVWLVCGCGLEHLEKEYASVAERN